MCRSPPTKEATTSLWAGPSAHGRGIKAVEEGTPPPSPAPQVVSLSPVRNRAGSA